MYTLQKSDWGLRIEEESHQDLILLQGHIEIRWFHRTRSCHNPMLRIRSFWGSKRKGDGCVSNEYLKSRSRMLRPFLPCVWPHTAVCLMSPIRIRDLSDAYLPGHSFGRLVLFLLAVRIVDCNSLTLVFTQSFVSFPLTFWVFPLDLLFSLFHCFFTSSLDEFVASFSSSSNSSFFFLFYTQ